MALTNDQLWAYADLSGILRRVTAAGDQTVVGVGAPIHLSGPSPVCGSGEQEVGRYGGGLEIKGSFRDEDDDENTLSVGQIAHAAAEVLVTDERLVFSLVHGATRAGEARDRQAIVVFDYPWQIIETVETRVKPTMTDRIAGGKPVTVSTISTGMAVLEFVVKSEMSPPPNSQPMRKVKPDELMGVLVGVGGQWRLRDDPGPDEARLTRVLQGEYTREDDAFVAYLVDPDAPASQSADVSDHQAPGEPVQVPAPPVPSAPAPLVPAAPSAAAAPAALTSTEPEPAEVRDRFCVACGKPLQENARFCRGCGHQVGAIVESAAP